MAYALISRNLDAYFVRTIVDYFLMQWPRGQFVAADLRGGIAGYLAGSRLSGGRASIALFCVDSDLRGRGIGSQLLSRFMLQARLEGMRSVQLEVREENFAAIEFYRNRGFMPVERMESFYEDGGNGIRMVSNGLSLRSN